MSEQIRRDVADFHVPSTWVVGARSMLVDRAVPRLEFLWMPKTIQPGGWMGLDRDRTGIAPEQKRGWKIPAHRILRKDYGVPAQKGPVLDLRLNSPENWAHAQIFHLPLAQMAREWIRETPTVLLTFGTPKFIRALYQHFGFPVIATDRAVSGDIITPKVSNFDVLRPARRDLVAGLVAELDQRRHAGEFKSGLPKKIFIVRAKTRRIENEDEIYEYLSNDGYERVLPEKLSASDQIELFNGATHIVSIHGAALAPLLFRSPSMPPFELIEILSPGHMATSYRLMAAQLGGSYIGIRGRLKPAMIEPSYQFKGVYRDHSLDDFGVDLESLKAARDIIATGAPPQLVA